MKLKVVSNDVTDLLDLINYPILEIYNVHLKNIFNEDFIFSEKYDLEKITASILTKNVNFKNNIHSIEIEIVIRDILISYLCLIKNSTVDEKLSYGKLVKDSIDSLFKVFACN
jgi:hypothetical protein